MSDLFQPHHHQEEPLPLMPSNYSNGLACRARIFAAKQLIVTAILHLVLGGRKFGTAATLRIAE
jgi:hypothetical protein